MKLGKVLRSAVPFVGPAADIVGAFMGHSAQKKANKANVALQRENQSWEEKMSNTSWQRGVEDMKAAGMNPMLAYSQGGSSTPNTSAATVAPEDSLARGATSAGSKAMNTLAYEQLEANIRQTNQITRKAGIEADTAKINYNIANAGSAQRVAQAEAVAETELATMKQQLDNLVKTGQLTSEQANSIKEQLPFLKRQAEAQAKMTEAAVPSAQAEAELYKNLDKDTGWFGKALEKVIKLRKALK